MRMLLAAVVVLLAGLQSTSAQSAPRCTVEKLADGVYAVMFNPDAEVEGNTLVVINDEDVLVVDSNAGITTAKLTLAEIKKLTPKPVRYVVNTHWHDDHVYGNQVYADAYPGVEFIAHPLTRRDIVNHTFGSNAFVIDLIAADVKRLQGYLDSGTYRDGRKVEGELEKRIRDYLANRREALADRQAARALVPTIDVEKSLTLKRGAREIRIEFLGRGNTRGDLVVYLPKERIVATGDLVVWPVPYATNVYARDWPVTLDKLMKLPASIVLPGHGPVMRDWTYVRQVRRALQQYLDGVAHAKNDGLSLKETQDKVQLPDVRQQFTGDNEGRRAGFEAFFRPTFIRSAWEEVDPQVMRIYDTTPLNEVVPSVYNFASSGQEGVTAIVNEKEVIVVSALTSRPAAHAFMRALRELTSKPVKHVIASTADASTGAAMTSFREAFPQVDVLTPTDGAEADKGSLASTGREIRLSRGPGRLIVALPAENVRIERGGSATRAR